MIYESAVPLTRDRHGRWGIEVSAGYGFSRELNSVPLTTVEFQAAAAEYVVIFAGTGDVVTPAVMLGLRENQNLYLAEGGHWTARYVPAFLRRYPFIFSSPDEGKSFTLCIDETFPGLLREGGGRPLYDGEQPSAYTQNVLRFLQQYQVEYQRTQAFCRKLRDWNLLEPMKAQVQLESGERVALGGFMAVDRARLKTLPAEKLAELVRSDELELLYTHLSSLRNFTRLRERMATATGGS